VLFISPLAALVIGMK